MKNNWLYLLIAFLLAAVIWMATHRPVREKEMRVVELKRELVRIDSLNRIEQKKQFDSLMHHIDSIHHKIADYERINNRLQQQNSKLDAIYRSVHVTAMPDL